MESMLKKLLFLSLLAFLVTPSMAKTRPKIDPDLSDSITASFSTERNADHSTSLTPNITYQHDFGNGFQFGLQTETTQNRPSKVLDSRIEIDGYYHRSFLNNKLLMVGGIGIGQEFVSPTNFPYYSIYGGMDFNLTEKLAWNVIQYQWRDAFDRKYDFGSNQLGTGMTYMFDKRHSMSLSVFETTDRKWKKQSTGISIGYTFNY